VFLAGLGQLHGDELVSLLLETLDNFTNKSTLDTIGLDLNTKEHFGTKLEVYRRLTV
jgi:hypothetical protein